MSAYEPGTVAVATVRGVPNVRVWRVVVSTAPRWIAATRIDGTPVLHWDEDVTDVRPLVTLDPDDETAWLVPMVVAAENYEENTPVEDQSWEDMARAMVRSLTRPPKPAEPTGLGAVVEDAEGRVFVRQCTGSDEQDMSHPWLLLSAGREPMLPAKVEKNWREIPAVRVLSEGVRDV